MVDDDHDNTLFQVTGKCRPYPHFETSVIAVAVMRLWPQKCMTAKIELKQRTQVIPLLTNAENL